MINQRLVLTARKRMWNRYRNYIAGLAVVVVAVIIFAIVLKSCGHKNNKKNNDETTAPVTTQEQITSQQGDIFGTAATGINTGCN